MRVCRVRPIQAVAGLALVAVLGGCAGVVSSPSSSPPTDTRETRRAPAPSSRPVDPQLATRLQRVMTPLIKAMDHPRQLSQVKIGILDDQHINAASGGNGEFYVTRGLLEKADDNHLAGVLAHEIAHDDLNHVAKAQTLGAGLNIGMVILDQIFPGTGAIAPIAGELIFRRYSRTEEYAADKHGADLLQRAGMRREIMADTLEWLVKTEGGSQGGFFSTHPATAERIEALRRMR
jgi:Zn-dependent protease with chaperone function